MVRDRLERSRVLQELVEVILTPGLSLSVHDPMLTSPHADDAAFDD
jgi:hypothetical protein